ncbi:serine/threonine-protein kinase pim-2 [Pimephales promelas]|nr:serine/threonine-protein kinase pim-2 [Pimephales promelas]
MSTIIINLLTDDILSRFEIGKMLGEGGFGSVYEGKRLEDGLKVAVKFVKKSESMEYINIPGHPTPLPLEVGLLILVNRGPKVREIIELLDWQDQPDQYIMVLERPSHCIDVFEFLDHHEAGFLDEKTAQTIMAQATTAAHMCCRRGVFHSDIKLENLLINTETHEVKLIDFGCGDFLQESAYDDFCGTDDYCPPEFHTEGKYHAKPATVWSLGVLLFLLVRGRYPKPKDLKRIYDDTWSKPDFLLVREVIVRGRVVLESRFFFTQVRVRPLQPLVRDTPRRKRSSRSAQVFDSHEGTSSTSSTSVAESHQHFCVGEGNERPMRKRKRTDS